MILTCCDNPVHIIDNVEHHFDSYSSDLRATVTWACATCGSRTTIDKMRIDANRNELLREALSTAHEHSFNSVVKQRYGYNNEVDVEDGGVVTPGIRVR